VNIDQQLVDLTLGVWKSDIGRATKFFGDISDEEHLAATDGSTVDLSELSGRIVVYAYPRTGQPGVALPDGWDMLPGARGCTPQSCSFRDHHAELKALGVNNLFGLSTQDTGYQREAAQRLHLPFPLLSDDRLELARTMRLPTFETSGMVLLKRLTLVIEDGVVRHCFYPVFPPDRSAGDVVAWLSASAGQNIQTDPLLNC
jgi:peroxiredoxin